MFADKGDNFGFRKPFYTNKNLKVIISFFGYALVISTIFELFKAPILNLFFKWSEFNAEPVC